MPCGVFSIFMLPAILQALSFVASQHFNCNNIVSNNVTDCSSRFTINFLPFFYILYSNYCRGKAGMYNGLTAYRICSAGTFCG